MPKDNEICHIVAGSDGVKARLGDVRRDAIRPVRLRVLELNDELAEDAELREVDEWLAFFSEPAERARACVRGKGRVVTRVRFNEPIATCVQAAKDVNIDIIRLPWSGIEVVRQYFESNRFSEGKDRFLIPRCTEALTYQSMQAHIMEETKEQSICVPQEPLSNVRSLFGKLASPDHELLFPRRH